VVLQGTTSIKFKKSEFKISVKDGHLWGSIYKMEIIRFLASLDIGVYSGKI